MLPIPQQKADQSLCKTRSLQFCNIQGPVGARSQRSPASVCSAVGSSWPLLYSKPGITRSYRSGSAFGPVCCFRKLSQLWLVPGPATVGDEGIISQSLKYQCCMRWSLWRVLLKKEFKEFEKHFHCMSWIIIYRYCDYLNRFLLWYYVLLFLIFQKLFCLINCSFSA